MIGDGCQDAFFCIYSAGLYPPKLERSNDEGTRIHMQSFERLDKGHARCPRIYRRTRCRLNRLGFAVQRNVLRRARQLLRIIIIAENVAVRMIRLLNSVHDYARTRDQIREKVSKRRTVRRA